MIKRTVFVAAVAAAMFASSIAPTRAAAADPFVGTWKLNVARSKIQVGTPPKSSVVTIEMVGDKRRLTVHTIPAEGPESRTESVAAEDGKDYPMKGSATVDAVSLVRVAPRVVERRDKKDGKVVATLTATVSANGKTLTVNQKGINPAGQTYANVLIYDRQ